MLKPPPIGDQELALLKYVADRGAPVSVREAAQEWGEPNNKARTTVLTMMERLREKDLLLREKSADGATFQYRAAVDKTDLLRGLVEDFVHKTLGGSVTPFMAYLADAGELSADEIAELRRLIDALDERPSEDAGRQGRARG